MVEDPTYLFLDCVECGGFIANLVEQGDGAKYK